MTGRILLCVLASSALLAAPAQTQSSVQQRTRAITEHFNKKSHSKKTRNGITVERYKEMRSEPVYSPQLETYAGQYFVDGSLLSLNLTVARDGRITGSGTEQFENQSGIRRTYTLRDARIEGALLTATKVYGNGSTAPLEGVFMKLTAYDSPTTHGPTSFGIGLVGPFYFDGNVTFNMAFFERR